MAEYFLVAASDTRAGSRIPAISKIVGKSFIVNTASVLDASEAILNIKQMNIKISYHKGLNDPRNPRESKLLVSCKS